MKKCYNTPFIGKVQIIIATESNIKFVSLH